MSRYDHMATAQMELSLVALARWARAYAATGPKHIEDQLHQEIDELLDEHRRRRRAAGSPSSPENSGRP
ncbi:hypothetical protein [Streptomyces griseorubiginosus]|jgi:hypothetical protein|uniref:hypothetical protein n=1 Tax=Streptomyces griseorubiginosus TaxID=67304 RepID=UPI002E80478B|nr:hypothetical protein [Streptomyces griseorubiginosus]WUB58863.1 hypothetical protein OG942_43610 [Streptomyces griseorubiginosus]